MSFLPNDYKEPETVSKYFKMKTPGEYRIRILDSAMTAFCGWTAKTATDKGKPVRTLGNDPKFWIKNGVDPQKVRHVWILPIWNYQTGSVQVWEIHQKSLRDPIKALADNPKWGPPFTYDLAITRKGTGMDDTEWSVIAEPKSELPEDAWKAWEEAKENGFDLNRLLDGGDPFGSDAGF